MTNKEKYKHLSRIEIEDIACDYGMLCKTCVGKESHMFTGVCEGKWCQEQIEKWLDKEYC